VNAPSREDTEAPAAVPAAPDRSATPLPATFRLTADPSTMTFGDGTVLMGGSPLRLLRLSERARTLNEKWNEGAPVGDRRGARLLARRLVSAGLSLPHPTASSFTADDVTVVIPVRDRPDPLRELLASLEGLSCVVVDDASRRPALTEQVAREVGARYIALEVNRGPGAARNAGLAAASTPLVAFVDSDCIPTQGWLELVLGHFDDPLVAIVAPRIVPAPMAHQTWITRYEAVRSSLDMGPAEGLVRPMSRIPYVPSATLVVRRDVASQPLFDPALRSGEDVDLVWRVADAGWDVRYVPAASVRHHGPETFTARLGRRFFYGTSAGPLARRHPSAMAPLRTSAWTAAVWGLVLRRRPLLAAVTLGASVLVLSRRLTGLVDQPERAAARIAGGGTMASALPALSGLTRAWSPALGLGLCFRRTRRAAALALLAPAVNDWVSDRTDLDPVRFAALHVTDDLAYGSGVWLGCAKSHTIRPLLPQILLRNRVWSAQSLRTRLGGVESPTPKVTS
jgi:mycofactocin glycosyltransferase